MNILRSFALACPAIFAFSACSDDALEGADTARVKVFNDSPVAVSNVRVMTAEGSEFMVPIIQPGETSAEKVVAALHEYPIVTLTAAGKSLGAHPVEGFAPGWNRRLPAGSYTIKVQLRSADSILEVTVMQIVEQSR